jgi:hypothetical protein
MSLSVRERVEGFLAVLNQTFLEILLLNTAYNWDTSEAINLNAVWPYRNPD